MSVLLDAVIYALEHAELPALKVKLKNDDGNARKIQQQRIEKLEKQLEEYREQEEEQFDLLETKVYTPDVFERRNAKLRAKIEDTQTALFKARSVMPEHVDFAERIVTLKDAIDALKDPEATPTEKNRTLKTIVERIEYHGPPSDRDNKKRQTRNGVDPFNIKVSLRL
jgi:DNA repair exonuclease SbcCD ATPase subunit